MLRSTDGKQKRRWSSNMFWNSKKCWVQSDTVRQNYVAHKLVLSANLQGLIEANLQIVTLSTEPILYLAMKDTMKWIKRKLTPITKKVMKKIRPESMCALRALEHGGVEDRTNLVISRTDHPQWNGNLTFLSERKRMALHQSPYNVK